MGYTQILNITWEEILSAINDYYGTQIATEAMTNHMTKTELLNLVDKIPEYNTVLTKSGEIKGFTKTLTYTARNAVNSTFDTTLTTNTATGIEVAADNTAALTTVETGTAASSATTVGRFVFGEVAPAVAAVGTGIQLGVAIDKAIYAEHPDWWYYNIENWDNYLLGHDTNLPLLHDTSTGISYIDAGAFCNVGNSLNNLEAFTTYPKKYTYATTHNVYVYSAPYGIKNEYLSATGVTCKFISLTSDIPLVYWANSSDKVVYCMPSQKPSGTDIVVNIKLTYSQTDSGQTDTYTQDLTLKFTHYNNIYNPAVMPCRKGWPSFFWHSDSMTANEYDVANIYYTGTKTSEEQIGGVAGVSTAGTVPTTFPLTVTNLATQYPSLTGNAVHTHGVSKDGSQTDITWLPIPLPTNYGSDNADATSKTAMPITGNLVQNNTGAYPDDATKNKALTQPVTQSINATTGKVTTPPTGANTYPTSGTGSTPVTTMPSGNISNGLCMVYNPTRAELVSFSQWLWSSNFLDQILKIFNNPMQAIVGLHEIYVTPVDGGNADIVVGYLDSKVSSPYVSQRYNQINCGTVTLSEKYGDVFDYSPYTSIDLFLPFIGFVSLSVGDCMRSTIGVKYTVDVLTGATLATINITRDGNTVHSSSYGGNCASALPISSGSYMGIVSALAGAALSVGSAVATGGASLPMSLAGAGASVLSGHTNVQKSGGFNGNTGAMDDKKPFIIISRTIKAMPAQYNKYQGFPYHKTEQLISCTGFTKALYVRLNNDIITSEEKKEIKSLLESGVIL